MAIALAAGVAGLAGPAPAAPAPASIPAPAAMVDVSATVTGLRSEKGQVLACLTTRADAFPDCAKDPEARKLTVPVHGREMRLAFGRVPAGDYAIALIHDENANGKLDTRLMIPREGFGFSRDAAVRMGPPSFRRAAFAVGREDVHLDIRMRYLF